ncbi:hypothetical protein SAMN04487939_104104 [Lysobacter sp. yr284]|nr:hypothetical protein SAMN04487939_104104 [Lysobacter sp. yr284]
MRMAERNARRVATDGSEAILRVRIGPPHTRGEDRACAVEPDDGFGPASRPEIQGVDARQAMMPAMGVVRAMPQARLRQGRRLRWPCENAPCQPNNPFPSAQ